MWTNGEICLRDLPVAEKNYLTYLDDGKDKSAVYFRRNDGKLFLVKGYTLKNIEHFERTAPESLYRGVVVLKLHTAYGLAVIYNKVRRKLCLPEKIILPEDGVTIAQATRDLINEEMIILVHRKNIVVPEGFGSSAKPFITFNWGVAPNTVMEIGKICKGECCYDDDNRVVEFVVFWGIPREYKPIILRAQDCSSGFKDGSIVYIVDIAGELVGACDGLKGFISFDATRLHIPHN